MIPLKLLAAERQSGTTANRILRDNTKTDWQTRWDNATNGRWTHRLISDLKTWLTRRHGQMNFYLAQLLTGHGCLKACENCGPGVVEDAKHSIFMCNLFLEERAQSAIGTLSLSPDNLVDNMIADETVWTSISNLESSIMKELRRRERLRNATAN
ncbi:hypothetical protein ACLKA6_000217 [Drosophila palustris]